MARPDLRSRSRCPACEALLPRAALRCGACGRELFAAETVEETLRAAAELVDRVAGEPWLQSVDRLSYVLHSHARGFLREHGDRLRQPIGEFVEPRLAAHGDLARTQLLPHAVDAVIRERSSALAGLVEEALRAPADGE